MTQEKHASDLQDDDVLLRISELKNETHLKLQFEIYGGIGHGRVFTQDLDREALGKLEDSLANLDTQFRGSLVQGQSVTARRECVAHIKALAAPAVNLFLEANPSGGKLKRFVLRVTGDVATRVPWEALEYACFACPQCWQHYAKKVECKECELSTSRVERRSLAEASGVVHLPTSSLRQDATENTTKFLFLVDPAGDVYSGASAAEKAALIAQHEKLKALIQELGYTIPVDSTLGMQDAAEQSEQPARLDPKTVLRLLKQTDIAGIYYFGHAATDDEGAAYLQLHGGRLYARDIRDQIVAPFVFLNACNSAAGSGSLAEAMSSLHSVVIGPTTKVHALDSVQFALNFFEKWAPSEAERTVAAAWRELTRELAQSRLSPTQTAPLQSEPSLLAVIHSLLGVYRTFGSKTAQLPRPLPTRSIDLFAHDLSRTLEVDNLSKGVREVMQAAFHSSEKGIDVRDVTNCLELRGNLTRHMLDALVLSAGQVEDLKHSASVAAIARDDLDPILVCCFQEAAKEAASKGDQTLSERYLVKALIPHWPEDRDLSQGLLKASLNNAFNAPLAPVDDNGDINLSVFDYEARQLVLRAYVNAVDGVLTGSALFAEFVASARKRRKRCAGPGANALGGRRTDRLEAGDADRIPAIRDRATLVPLLHAASARRPEQLDVHQLFTLFCRTASRETRWLVHQEWHVELDELGCRCRGDRADVEKLELDPSTAQTVRSWAVSAQQVIQRFYTLTHNVHSYSNRLVLAAFLDQDDEHTAELLQKMPAVERKALSEYLIEASRSDELRWSKSAWQARSSDLVRRSERLDSNLLLVQFGRNLPRRFRAGLKSVAASWPDFELSWIVAAH